MDEYTLSSNLVWPPGKPPPGDRSDAKSVGSTSGSYLGDVQQNNEQVLRGQGPGQQTKRGQNFGPGQPNGYECENPKLMAGNIPPSQFMNAINFEMLMNNPRLMNELSQRFPQGQFSGPQNQDVSFQHQIPRQTQNVKTSSMTHGSDNSGGIHGQPNMLDQVQKFPANYFQGLANNSQQLPVASQPNVEQRKNFNPQHMNMYNNTQMPIQSNSELPNWALQAQMMGNKPTVQPPTQVIPEDQNMDTSTMNGNCVYKIHETFMHNMQEITNYFKMQKF